MLQFIIIINIIVLVGGAKLPVDFLADYLFDKNLTHVVLFSCSDQDYYEWLKYVLYRQKFGFLTSRGEALTCRNLNGIRLFDYTKIYSSYIQIGIILNFDCPQNVEYLKAAPKELFSTSQYHWLILSSDTTQTDFTLNLENHGVPLTLESDVTTAIEQNSSIVLGDVYKFDRSWRINVSCAGRWKNGSGLQWFWTQSRRDRRINMHGLVITAGMVFIKLFNVTTDPDLFLNPDFMKGQDGLSRHAYELWTYLSDIHNFTINITSVEKSYGGPNGSSFDGLIGVLQREEADVGLVAVVLTEERQDVVEFVRVLRSFWGWRPVYVFLHPKTSSKMTALIEPVSLDAWLGIAFVSVLFSIILCASHKNLANLIDRSSFSIIFVAAIIAQQGVSHFPIVTKLSVRILVMSALLFGFMIIFFYNATILTFLLSMPPKTIRSFKQLVDGSLQLGSDNAGHIVDVFLRLNVARAKEAYSKKMNMDSFIPFMTGMEKVRKEQYAYMSEDQKVFRFMEENFTDTETCGTQVIDLLPTNFPFTIPIQKGSPFGEFLARGFLLLLERGIVNRVDHRWMYFQPMCVASEFVPVEIDEVFFAILVILTGIFAALVLFLAELLSGCDMMRGKKFRERK